MTSSSSSPEIQPAPTADAQERFTYKHASHEEVLEDLSRFLVFYSFRIVYLTLFQPVPSEPSRRGAFIAGADMLSGGASVSNLEALL